MAKQASEASSMELAHYVAVLRRRRKYVAAGLVLGVALAILTVVLAPSRSTSTTLVNVNLITSKAFDSTRPASDLIDATTEQVLVRSSLVMSEVAEELGGSWTKASVRADTEATMLPEGTVLRIEFTAGSAQVAADGAALIAEKYLAYRSETAEARVSQSSERLVSRRNTLTRQLARINTAVADALPGSADQLTGEMERQRISEELSSVTTQLNELQAINTSGGEVFTEADPAQVATSPNRLLILVSGTLGGLLLGLVLAFVANVLDRRVRDEYDVAGAGGGSVLARLRGDEPELPATGHDVDQVRALRERLMSAVDARRPVLAVLEVAGRDTLPSDLAANLAVSLADSGLTTDLVLADYPQASVNELVESLGVTEITPLERARRFRGGVSDTLTVVVPEAKGTRFSTSDLLAELVADDVRVAECTVVGVAPGAGESARLTAGRASHQLVLGVFETSTSIDELADVATGLRAVWAVVLGTVLVPRERHLGVLPTDGLEKGGADAPETGGAEDEPVGSGSGPALSVQVSEVASERGRNVGQASRKARLRAGNSALVSTAADKPDNDSPEVVPVLAPVITPVDEPIDEANSETDSGAEGGPGAAEEVDAPEMDRDEADPEQSDREQSDREQSDPDDEDEEDEEQDNGPLSWAFSR